MLTTQPVLMSSEVAYRREQVTRSWGRPLLPLGRRARAAAPARVRPPVVCPEPRAALPVR
ncbi:MULTISPECIES: hypothetical protein [unclassified Ornithinimicrobium]|uniref:hypothetical protein n=1 Tax=unclassified Ornithinimicrobium TaxID=2615080 RepID=UPI003851F249